MKYKVIDSGRSISEVNTAYLLDGKVVTFSPGSCETKARHNGFIMAEKCGHHTT
jgi:hypothetical protein